MSQHKILQAKSPDRWGIIFNRSVIWPLLALSYGSVFAAMTHWLTDTWSGLATLGMPLTIFIGVPSLGGNAGYLWRKGLHKIFRWEAALSAALPIVLLTLAGAVIFFGRIKTQF
ncbi:MAG: hypothetical protein K2X55_02835 [Burkholderiaceae bacterium]|nr:hypothetical protein [Burkholderiaceae bacterium]